MSAGRGGGGAAGADRDSNPTRPGTPLADPWPVISPGQGEVPEPTTTEEDGHMAEEKDGRHDSGETRDQSGEGAHRKEK